MTDREKAIVMAYTGIAMLRGDKLHIFYEYVSEKLGRPIWTHEFAGQADTIKELSKDDFFGLCDGEQNDCIGHWVVLKNCSNDGVYCSECQTKIFDRYPMKKKYSYFCPHCGARMEGQAVKWE